MKIDYTFHSHTYRCGHAVGDIEDYVSLAIDKGIKVYGVSDHVFLPNIHEPKTRGDYSLLDEYIEEFKKVKSKYRNKIEMYLGFECEYSDYFKDYYRYLLKDKGFDYLICGQHFNYDKGYCYGYGFDSRPLSESLPLYKKDLIDAMKSGLFLYIAHPDIFFMGATELTDEFKELTKEIIEEGIKYNAVFEVNIHGFYRNHDRRGNHYIDYPVEYFWKEVAKTNIKIVHGGDYHNPDEITDEKYQIKFDEFISATNIKFSDIKKIYINYKNRLKNIL